MPELEEPKVPVAPEPLVVKRTLAAPVVRENVTEVSLPQRQHFTVTLNGRDYCVYADLKDMPDAVREYILALGEAQAPGLLSK